MNSGSFDMLKSNPFFSIVIPVFNSEKTIGACLQSILSQTFTDYEVLIMDGCSSDATLPITESFSDHRIKIHSQKDNGIYDAMNKGINHAGGKWLYFLGGDDYLYDHNVLEDVYRFINTHKIASFVYGNVFIKEPLFGSDQNIYDGEFTIYKLTARNISHQAIFYNKSLFKRYGLFNTNYRVCADYDFNLLVFQSSNPVFCNRIIACFGLNGTSSTITDQNFSADYFMNAITKYKLPESAAFIKEHKTKIKICFKMFVYQLKFFSALKLLVHYPRTVVL